MATPSRIRQARPEDVIPVVADAAARDARFPRPTEISTRQRVQRLDTQQIERWVGNQWVVMRCTECQAGPGNTLGGCHSALSGLQVYGEDFCRFANTTDFVTRVDDGTGNPIFPYSFWSLARNVTPPYAKPDDAEQLLTDLPFNGGHHAYRDTSRNTDTRWDSDYFGVQDKLGARDFVEARNFATGAAVADTAYASLAALQAAWVAHGDAAITEVDTGAAPTWFGDQLTASGATDYIEHTVIGLTPNGLAYVVGGLNTNGVAGAVTANGVVLAGAPYPISYTSPTRADYHGFVTADALGQVVLRIRGPLTNAVLGSFAVRDASTMISTAWIRFRVAFDPGFFTGTDHLVPSFGTSALYDLMFVSPLSAAPSLRLGVADSAGVTQARGYSGGYEDDTVAISVAPYHLYLHAQADRVGTASGNAIGGQTPVIDLGVTADSVFGSGGVTDIVLKLETGTDGAQLVASVWVGPSLGTLTSLGSHSLDTLWMHTPDPSWRFRELYGMEFQYANGVTYQKVWTLYEWEIVDGVAHPDPFGLEP